MTKDAVIVEQREIMPLTEGKARETDYAEGYMPELVEHLRILFAEKAAELQETPLDADADEDEDDGTIVVIQADKDLDYQTLYLVMRSASMAGFTRHRLAVMKK